MKKPITILCLSGILVTCIVIMVLPFSTWFLSPTRKAQCLPVAYVEDASTKYPSQRDIKPFVPDVTRTKLPLEAVKQFYDENLPLGESGDDVEEGQWDVWEVRRGEFLYQCMASLSWDEGETGCVYIRERDGKTVVETIWLYSVSVSPACAQYMSELPY